MTFVELIKERKMGNEEGEIFHNFPHHTTNNATVPQVWQYKRKRVSVHCAHCRYFRFVLFQYTTYYLALRPFSSRITIHTYSFFVCTCAFAVTVPYNIVCIFFICLFSVSPAVFFVALSLWSCSSTQGGHLFYASLFTKFITVTEWNKKRIECTLSPFWYLKIKVVMNSCTTTNLFSIPGILVQFNFS